MKFVKSRVKYTEIVLLNRLVVGWLYIIKIRKRQFKKFTNK